MEVQLVNAFTTDVDGGNPAGVVLAADNLSEAKMLRIAKQVGYSETAFVSNSDVSTFKVRFFTPVAEVDLCGHATIATWHLLFDKGLIEAGLHTQETLAGNLQVDVKQDGLVFMEQSKAIFHDKISLDIVAQLLNIDKSELSGSIIPRVVSTGLKDLLVCVKNKNVLNKLQPNFDEIKKISEELDIVGLHVFALGHEGYIAYARNFAPLYDINEESATGTSNGALLSYLKKLNKLPNEPQFKVIQGESMGKISRIYGFFIDEIVWIGGFAKTFGNKSTEA